MSMKFVMSVLMFSWVVTSVAAAQSLTELAEQEKDRRRKLREQANQTQTYDEYDLRRAHHGLAAARNSDQPIEPDTKTIVRLEKEQSEAARPPIVLASMVEEAMPEATRDVEFQRSRGGQLPMQAGVQGITTTGNDLFWRRGRANTSDVFFDGTLYTDWFRIVYDDGFTTSQLSTRLAMARSKSAITPVFSANVMSS